MSPKLFQAAWSAVNFLLALIGLGQVINWLYRRTKAGRKNELLERTAILFYENRDLFVMTENSYSIPAFLHMGHHAQEGMTLREWAYYALRKPSALRGPRDGMEYLSILSTARRLIEQTLNDPKDQKWEEVYDQLGPRFDKLCAALNDLQLEYRDECPIQYKQRYLPSAPASRGASSDLERTR